MRSVRVQFEKFGLAKYISHLDLNRFMIKIIRKSGIPVWYSEGFNPHPYITFALPLSLGFESNNEFMDIRLDDDSFTNEQVFNALNNLMPDGLKIVSCADPVMKAGDISYAEYLISFETSDTVWCSKLIEFLSCDSIVTQKKTKKGSYKDIDLKEFIAKYSTTDFSLRLTLAAGGSNNLNPKLIFDTFEKKHDCSLPYYLVCRTALLNDKFELFK